MKNLCAILAAVILASSLRAEVTVEALAVAGERAKTRVPELHVFGGQPAELEVAVEAPLGAKVSLAAALFQVASGIAFTWNPAIEAGCCSLQKKFSPARITRPSSVSRASKQIFPPSISRHTRRPL